MSAFYTIPNLEIQISIMNGNGQQIKRRTKCIANKWTKNSHSCYPNIACHTKHLDFRNPSKYNATICSLQTLNSRDIIRWIKAHIGSRRKLNIKMRLRLLRHNICKHVKEELVDLQIQLVWHLDFTHSGRLNWPKMQFPARCKGTNGFFPYTRSKHFIAISLTVVILLLIASVDPTTEADMNNLHFNYIVLHVSRLCISVFIVILNDFK
jgi:hypothetical protein